MVDSLKVANWYAHTRNLQEKFRISRKSLAKISLILISLSILTIFFIKIPIAIQQESVKDAEAPQWYNIIVFPQPPVVYSHGASYQFNITATDNFEMDKVLFEFDRINYTAKNESSVYYYVLPDLAIGNYSYRWYMNDTSGNTNVTETFNYTVIAPTENATQESNIGFDASFNQTNATEQNTTDTTQVVAMEEVLITETIQGDAEVGKPVKWIRKVKSPNKTLAENLIPKGASIFFVIEKEDLYEIEYETLPPYKEERLINPFILGEKYRKRITVKSDFSEHYRNVKSYTDVPEELLQQGYTIRLYHILNGEMVEITEDSQYNVLFVDSDSNGLVNRIEWVVPQLSEQEFEVEAELTIINVQSYPTVGGNWTVRFNTVGTADLTITPVDNTEFFRDLEFLELMCGNERVGVKYNGTSVSFADWSCTEEGKIVNKVLTTGKHTLEFRFGNDVEYAYNLVGDTRANSVTFFIGQYTGTGSAGQSSNVNYTFTSNFSLAETGVSIKDAFIIFESMFGAYAAPPAVTGYLLAFDSCQAPCIANATDGSGNIVDDNANTLAYSETESNYGRLLLNVTKEAQLSTYTGNNVLMNISFSYQLKTASTVTNFISSAKAKLVITYTYDSSSSSYTNTVIYPLESVVSGDQGTRGASQADDCTKNTNCPLFNYTVRIPEFDTGLSQWFEITTVNDGNLANDIITNVNIQGTDVDSANYVFEAANGGTQGNIPQMIFSGVSGYTVNSPQTLEVVPVCPAGTGTYYLLGGEVFQTYNASSSASTKTKTVMFPIDKVTDGSVTTEQSASTTVYFPESNVKIEKAWFRIVVSGEDTSGARTVTVASKVGSNSKSGNKVYNLDVGGNIVAEHFTIYHVIPSSDYAELQSATASSGKEVRIYTTHSATDLRGVSAVLMITYNYTDDLKGYLSSLSIFGGQESEAPSLTYTTAAGAIDPVLPETTGTKTIRGAALYSSYLFSDTGGSMTSGVINVDANISTTSSCTVSNTFDMDDDAANAYSEFYRNVTEYLTNSDTQTYTVCYSNDNAIDAQLRAKHNGILYYIYQWDDTTPPKWFDNSTNVTSPNVGDVVSHNVRWTDNSGLSYYFFEWNATGANCDAGFSNVTEGSISGTNTWVNVSQTILSACEGKVIAWRQYVNDTNNNWNTTDLFVYTVQQQPPTIGNTQVNTSSTDANTYICVNATASDDGAGIDKVWAQVTFPNNTAANITMSDTGPWCSGSGSDNKYGVEVNVGSTAGILTVNTSFANDTLGNSGYESPYPNLQVSVTIPNYPPTLGDRIEVPTSPTIYSSGTIYMFNITVDDQQGETDISKVIFEFDGENETVTTYVIHNSTARNYSVTKTNLAANPIGYTFRWYVNDSKNAWGNVVEGTYVINKAIPSLAVDFSQDPVEYPTETTATCNKDIGDYSAILTLYRNDTQIAQGSGASVSETITLGAGSWNYTCAYDESENYTASIITNKFLDVNKGTPSLNLLLDGISDDLVVIYPNETNATGYESNIGDDDITYSLYRNTSATSTLVGSASNVQDTLILGANSYYYVYNNTEGANWTANSLTRTLTVQQNTSTIDFMNLTINGTESNKEYTYPAVSNATGWFDQNAFVGPIPTFILYRNETEIGSSSDVVQLAAGFYNYTYYTAGNANYSSATKNYWLFIDKGDPSSYINLYIDNQTSDKTIIYPAISEIRGNVSIQGANDLIFNLYRNNIFLGSGNATNQTVDKTKLGNATYIFVYNTTGGANWTSGSSATRTLYVLKGNVPLRLAINETETSQTLTYENITNTTGWSEVTGEDLTFNLYRDGVLKSSNSPATEIIRLGVGTYTYVYNTSGGANYTSNSTSLTLTIDPKNISIYLALNDTQNNRTYTYPEATNATAWKDPTIDEEGTVTLLRDGVSKGSGQIVTEVILLGNGTYNYSATFSATNYTASNILSGRFALVNKGIPPVYLAINGTQGNVTYTYPTASNATGWLGTYNNEGSVELWRDGVSKGSGDSVTEEILLGAGEYNYSLTFAETQNYSYSSITQDRFLKINKATSIATLTLVPSSPIVYETETTATCAENNPEATGKLWRNSMDVSSENDTAVLLPAGTWEYTCNVTETENYTSATDIQTYIVNPKNANVQVYPSTQTVTYPTSVLQYCTDEASLMDCNIYRNDSLVSNNTEITLAAGVYVYKANISDTANYTNYQDIETITINKAPSDVRLFLNNTEDDQIYTYEDYANITAELNISDKTFYIEANFTGTNEIINQGTSPLTNITNNFGAGVFNVTAYWNGDQNYTGDSQTYFMTVNKKQTTTYLWLNGTRGNIYYQNESYVNFTVELVGYPGKPIELWTNYTDGQWKKWDSGNSPIINITQLTKTGNFNFTGNFSGNANYTESYESWTVTVGVLTFESKLESLSPTSINQGQNSTAVGNCSCTGGTCNDVYMEIQADGNPIPNTSGSNLQVNGSNLYYLGQLSNIWATRSWDITGWEAGNYVIRIRCNSTETGDVLSAEKNLQVNDTTKPTWINNFTYPTSSVTYVPEQSYQFNLTWTDNLGISTVLIEHNFTTDGPLTNDTMSNQSSEYYFNVADLAAGTYVWRSYANDTNNNWNWTDQWVYTIEKAPTSTRLFLNGTEDDRTYNVSQTANFTVMLNISGKTVYLETNMTGWVLQSSTTPLYNYTILNQKGVFNITGYFLEDENYTSSSQTYYATTQDVEAPSWNNQGQNATWIGVNKTILLFANWTDNFDLDFAWLATNETKNWGNKTAVDINLTADQTWSNFTWSNFSVPAGWTIAWRIYANDSSGNEYATDIMSFVVNASGLWKFLTDGLIYSSSAVGDINDDEMIDVIFGSYDKQIYALNGSDGIKVWNFTTNGSVASSPSLGNLTGINYLDVVVGSYDFNMYLINGSNGNKIWNYSTGGMIFSSPAIADVNNDGFLDVVFGSADNKIYALNGSNGNQIWNYSTNGVVRSSPVVSNITPDGDPIVFVGSYDFNMYAINGSDGSKIWNFSAQDKIESSPAVDDVNNDGFLEVVFGSYDWNLYVINASDGKKLWNYTTENWVLSSPVIANISNSKKIIIGSHDSKIYAFDSDGTINWTFTIKTGGRIPSSPSIADINSDGTNDIIVGASDGRIYAISGDDGSLLWSYTVGQYIFSSPSLADVNGDGNLDIVFGSFNKYQYILDPPSWTLFGGNQRRTRIFDYSPPEPLIHGIERNESMVTIYSLWKEKFSNLGYATIKENSTGDWNLHIIKMKGTTDWANYSVYDTSFSYTITVYDEYENSEKIEGFVESEKIDTSAPTWLTNYDSLEFTYSPNQEYHLNVSWFDESKIEIVIIEHNFTGILLNETLENFDGNTYYFEIKDLPAGNYTWREYAKDVYRHWNSTDVFTLTVSKKEPSLEFVLPEEVAYPDELTGKCEKKESDKDGFLILFRNGTEIARGDLVLERSVLGAGYWYYSCQYLETQNYSNKEISKHVEVKKGLPKLNLLSDDAKNTCPAIITITAYENNIGDEDVSYRLYNNTHLIGEGSDVQKTFALLAGNYSFIYNSTEGKNWTSSYINKSVNVLDNSPPKNIYFRKEWKSREGGLFIYSLWQDNCSNLTLAILRENSTGIFKEYKIKLNGKIGWVNSTIPESDLKSENGCLWVGKFLCIKKIFLSIEVYDEYKNSNKINDAFTYVFIKMPFFIWGMVLS